MIAKFTRQSAKHLKRILLQEGIQQTTGKGSHISTQIWQVLD